MSVSMSNDLGLPPPKSLNSPPELPATQAPQSAPMPIPAAHLSAEPVQLEYIFELPTGFIDREGHLHRRGIMRLARTIDEVASMRDPRVQDNPAYATVIILSRVITRLGTLSEVSPVVIENLFARDLDYLQNFYRHINGLST
jgi:hypothetical protein